MRCVLRRVRHLSQLLAGRSVFDSTLYREAELARLANLFAHVDIDRWTGLRILEVGAGLGRIGDAFRYLGFDVTSTDGRPEHVDRMRYRGCNAFILDLDSVHAEDFAGYDIVLAFGVLYHLREPERFLTSCGENARVLLLESCVSDSTQLDIPKVKEKTGWRGQDQALHAVGCRPSPTAIERACKNAGFDVIRDISSPIANWSQGRFDWEPRGNGEWRREDMNLRRMWICERSSKLTSSPRDR